MVMRACERAFEGDANEVRCVEAVMRGRADHRVEALIDGGTRVDPTYAIDWCERSQSGDANELACLRWLR